MTIDEKPHRGGMHLKKKLAEKPRPRIHRADLLYHDALANLMCALHTIQHKAQKTYHYGQVSYLRLLHEGKLPAPEDETVQRDLAVYRDALQLHEKLVSAGGAA